MRKAATKRRRKSSQKLQVSNLFRIQTHIRLIRNRDVTMTPNGPLVAVPNELSRARKVFRPWGK
ncbi:MAG: hypothetical protein P8018_09995 [Acidobacteriota bacterium]